MATAAGSARGLALRIKHGSRSDHFTNQIKFWGIQPSYAFVAEPQTDAVPSGSNRLNEQIIHGRIYLQHRGAASTPIRDFIELYNAQWIVEKLTATSAPLKHRQAWLAAISIRPAA